MAPVSFERWRQNFAELVENLVGRRIDYAQLYPARVVSQKPNGTLEVLPDSLKIRGGGMNNVPIRHGLPGVSVGVSQGARVRIGFENGDPTAPYASLWDTDANMVEINLGDSTLTDFVALATKTDAQLTVLMDLLQGTPQLAGIPPAPVVWVPAPTDGGTALQVAANLLSLSSTAATKVKAE